MAVADLQQKMEIFARRYQIPLGSHPVRSKQRRLMLKANRRKYEEEAIKLEKTLAAEAACSGEGTLGKPSNNSNEMHHPFTKAEAQIAFEEMANNKTPGLSRIRKEDLELGGIEMVKLMTHLGDVTVREKAWPKCLKINCN